MTIRFTIEDDGQAYVWSGGFGATLKSCEAGVVVGTMRRIGKFSFYAYAVHEKLVWFSRKRFVSWSLAEDNVTAERLREVRQSLMREEYQWGVS